jgi:hypothetical protein
MDDKSYLELLSKLHQYRLPIYGKLKEDLQAKLEEFQKNIGLFQFYIYTSAMDKSGIVTLNPWMDRGNLIPWEMNRFVKCSWFKNFDPDVVEEPDRQERLIRNFHEIRKSKNHHAPDNQEFITLFNGLYNEPDFALLSEEEIQHSVLLVSDGELSLFSFLYALSEPKFEWNADSKQKKYWNQKFEELGFIDSDMVLSLRYHRMIKWIIENSKIHPSLSLKLKKDNQEMKLGEILGAFLSENDVAGQTPENIAKKFRFALERWKFEYAEAIWFPLLASREIFLRIPTIRFNVLGESELRKNENISRNFFAIPTMYISNEKKEVVFSTFAVGTILDVENLRDFKNLEKIRKLKTIMNELSRLRMDNSFYESILTQNETLTNTAIKAAISQVMARNMSHNIGSHVLSRFKSENDISKPVLEQYKSFEEKKSDNVSRTLFLAATFNNYLKNRMDYLADIATSDPVMENVMDFKNGLMKGIDDNIALLDRISGVSDKSLTYEFVLTKNREDYPEDIPISITNDILGAHAFYIILENIIRNIAKHSKLADHEKQVRITIDISDHQINNEFSEFYEVSIFDNISRPKDEIRKIVKSRNSSFNRSILDNYALRQTDLGTIEMDVCAAYLRCLPITSIELPEYELIGKRSTSLALNAKPDRLNNPLLIFAYLHSDLNSSDDHMGYLGYKLYFNRPKEVLVVDDDNSFTIADLSHDLMKQKGIRVIKSEEFLPESVFNYHFLYCHSKLDKEKLLYRNIPMRVVHKIDNASFQSPDSFMASLWERYICTKFPHAFPIKISNSSSSLTIGIGDDYRYKIEKPEAAVSSIFIDVHAANYSSSGDYSYYDMACSHHKLKKYIHFVPGGKSEFPDDIFIIPRSEYLEVVNTSIVVIDERIQESISNQSKIYSYEGNTIFLFDYFKKQKLFIPTKTEADLNELSFGKIDIPGSVGNNLKNYLNSPGNKEADFFIVHLGIIEKLLPSDTEKSEREIKNVINSLFEGIDTRKIVVTSGRGCPNNLPKDIAFVPIALIQNAIEASFDKVLLTKILYNSRTSKKA